MRSKDGFALQLTALGIVLALAGGCASRGPGTVQGPEAETPTASPASPVTRVDFKELELEDARLTITRDSPSPTPNEILRLSVKIADSSYTRSQGLMGVENLPSSAGMAFLYNRPVNNAFHMKNTLIPLDIAFWGEDRKIHQMVRMTPCKAEPCRTYEPKAGFVGALEVRGGLLQKEGVRVGDTVTITAQTTAEGSPPG